jgi:hypothetical protein
MKHVTALLAEMRINSKGKTPHKENDTHYWLGFPIAKLLEVVLAGNFRNAKLTS